MPEHPYLRWPVFRRSIVAAFDRSLTATMVAVGFHGRRGLLVLSNAGHPPPFWYRARRDEWAWFDADSQRQRPGVSGTPLGLLPDASYSRTIVKPERGDLIVLYSDGVSEATDPSGEELGRDGLMAMARGLDTSSAARFGTQLAQAVRVFRDGVPPQDDETLIVLERLSTVALPG